MFKKYSKVDEEPGAVARSTPPVPAAFAAGVSHGAAGRGRWDAPVLEPGHSLMPEDLPVSANKQFL